MARETKRKKEFEKIFNMANFFSIKEAIEILKKSPKVEFDQSIEFAMKLGIDPKKADQQVRGTISLPHGTGKKIVLAVFAKGDKAKEALEAGADFVGDEELLAKVQGGFTDFNAVISTPDMMREVGKLGKVLGPKGLMPSPKAGTVTTEIAKTINEMKKGKIEFKIDKSGVINNVVGKLSFALEHLVENIEVLINAILRAKPAGAKGIFVKSLAISSTMGPGVKIDIQSICKSE